MHTQIYAYVKLFVIRLEIPHTQVPHPMPTSQLNHHKSQITGSIKYETLEQGIPRQSTVINI